MGWGVTNTGARAPISIHLTMPALTNMFRAGLGLACVNPPFYDPITLFQSLVSFMAFLFPFHHAMLILSPFVLYLSIGPFLLYIPQILSQFHPPFLPFLLLAILIDFDPRLFHILVGVPFIIHMIESLGPIAVCAFCAGRIKDL